MYFFDLKGLIQHLRTHDPRPSETIKYMLGIITVLQVTQALSTGIIGRSAAPPSSLFVILIGAALGTAIGLAIGAWVLRTMLNANGGDAGRCFWERLIPLYFLISLRTTIPWLAAILIWKAIAITPEPTPALGVVAIVFAIGTLIYWFTLMRKSFAEISAPEPAQP